jgi:hypothetical protein
VIFQINFDTKTGNSFTKLINEEPSAKYESDDINIIEIENNKFVLRGETMRLLCWNEQKAFFTTQWNSQKLLFIFDNNLNQYKYIDLQDSNYKTFHDQPINLFL